VTINEPFFQGHFPAFPVMPGVLIIEGIAQTAGALCVSNLGENYRADLVYFMGIDKAKFRKPVLPGDQLHYHIRKIRSRGRVWRFFGEARVDGSVVAEAEISAMLADTNEARALAAQANG
jgi:3-hydroxyacyl-[acyl-carrier-protein] dehydratase